MEFRGVHVKLHGHGVSMEFSYDFAHVT